MITGTTKVTINRSKLKTGVFLTSPIEDRVFLVIFFMKHLYLQSKSVIIISRFSFHMGNIGLQ